eukprot:scaffold1135_cov343-Prasinococcus_capsulatus_cf.AAC.17
MADRLARCIREQLLTSIEPSASFTYGCELSSPRLLVCVLRGRLRTFFRRTLLLNQLHVMLGGGG